MSRTRFDDPAPHELIENRHDGQIQSGSFLPHFVYTR